MWGCIYFFTCENSRQEFRTQCATTLTLSLIEERKSYRVGKPLSISKWWQNTFWVNYSFKYTILIICLLWNLSDNTAVEGEWNHGFGEGCRTSVSSEQNAHTATAVPTGRAPGKLWWCNRTTRKLHRYLIYIYIYILKTSKVVCRTLTRLLL